LTTDYTVNIGELGEHAPGGILIKFLPTEYAGYVIQRYAESHRVLKGQSGIVKISLKKGLDVAKTLALLRQLPGVIEWAEPDYLVKRASESVVKTDSRVPARPETSSTAKKRAVPPTVIAVIDSGIDLSHPSVKKHLWIRTAVSNDGYR